MAGERKTPHQAYGFTVLEAELKKYVVRCDLPAYPGCVDVAALLPIKRNIEQSRSRESNVPLNLVTEAVGIAIGVPVAVAAARLVTVQLYGLAGADPRAIAAASGLLAAVAFVAGIPPARRAARVDPMVALRSD